MNILVIGNGFDLAHELPTKYSDFLEFCKRVFPIYENTEGRSTNLYQREYLFEWIFNKEIKDALKSAYRSRNKINAKEKESSIQTDYPRLDEMYSVIKNNIWIEYFLQCNMYQKENWIDFESEISKVIQSLDDDMRGLSELYSIEDIVCDLSNEFLKEKYSNYIDAVQPVNPIINDCSEGITFKEIRNKLLDDLNSFIRAFEIYLTEYVEKIDCKLISPDIQRTLPKEFMKINGMPVYNACVLSFNYTNTYQRLYIDKVGKYKHFGRNIDYIHGKADISNTIESNNMVLGIDEYLPENRKNNDIEFIAFKKFYQRIYKNTGCRYKEWLESIQSAYAASLKSEANCKKFMDYAMMRHDNEEAMQWFNKIQEYAKIRDEEVHNLYIFGHSLDITDKDILRDLILNDNVYTTIFHHDKDTMGQQIANLVKVIGQDELIRRTGGSAKTIEFKQQQPMIPIKE